MLRALRFQDPQGDCKGDQVKRQVLRLPLPLSVMTKLMEEDRLRASVANQPALPCTCEVGSHKPWWGRVHEPLSHDWRTVR
jgi:hypothetical protein